MSQYKANKILNDRIRANDISALKSGLINIIRFDQMFRTSKFNEQLKYIEDQGIKIRVPYEEEVDEYRLEKEDWTQDYFFHLMEWLRLNFAPSQRIPHMREVGRFVFKDTLKASHTPSFQEAPEDGGSQKKQKPGKQVELRNLLLPVLIILVVIMALIWVVKKGK